MSRTTFALLPVLLCASALSAKKPVTIESLFRPPSSGAAAIGVAVWSPDGHRFAYESAGKLWIYDAATQSRKEAGSLDALRKAAVKVPDEVPFLFENRRVTQQSIQWSADTKSLLLLISGDLFLWQIDSGKWEQLSATSETEHDPKLSPNGNQVSFRRGNELYVLDIASRKTRRLTFDASATLWNARLDWVYPEELALGTAHWWSPDSSSIAYLQFDVSRQMVYPHGDLLPRNPVSEPQRYPMAGTPNADVRLGVVNAAGGETRWMDLGETRDALLARVQWTPDSSSLFVQRLNRIQNRLDLLGAQASSGQVRTILTETDPHWVNVFQDVHFLSQGKRFIWTSERSGFRHLYIYTSDGKQLKQITSGDWEVTKLLGADEIHKQVFFVSTEKSPLERQLYRTGFDGKGRALLTQAAGTHTISMSPDCRFFIDNHSSLTQPPRRTVNSADAKEMGVLHEADRKDSDEYDLQPIEVVKVKSSDGDTMYARLFRPAGFTPGKKYPAVVMVYGGPHAQDVKDAWSGLIWEQALAQRGFVVWTLDNRGTAGRGHKWETMLYRRLGRQELEDQKTGVAQLLSMGFVDAQRVGIYGWSYGGFMTLYSLLNAPEVFHAGAAGAPVTDWRNYDTIYTERYLGLPSENPDGYRLSSPLHQAAELKRSLLIVHNLQDDNVLFQNSMQFMDALQRAGKPFELMIYPQKTHGVTGPTRRHLLETITSFFERNLKP